MIPDNLMVRRHIADDGLLHGYLQFTQSCQLQGMTRQLVDFWSCLNKRTPCKPQTAWFYWANLTSKEDKTQEVEKENDVYF